MLYFGYLTLSSIDSIGVKEKDTFTLLRGSKTIMSQNRYQFSNQNSG